MIIPFVLLNYLLHVLPKTKFKSASYIVYTDLNFSYSEKIVSYLHFVVSKGLYHFPKDYLTLLYGRTPALLIRFYRRII